MNILVINAGSSSLKYQLIDMTNEAVIAKGLVERIGIEGSLLKHKPTGKESVEITAEVKNHTQAITLVLNALVDSKHGVISGMDKIGAVGHRVVHGGEEFSGSVLINNAIIEAIKRNIDLAVLHNPANIMGIEACREVMPDVPMVGVFDTAFHQTMPERAYMYALPYEFYTRYRIRRYGFHGTSHYYVSRRAAAMVGRPIEQLKIITCHLGNGSSITAVDGGKSIDTTMGFTPLGGLPMGTRCGNIDPSIAFFLMQNEKMSVEAVNDIFNRKSGVLGLSGISSDFRDLWIASDAGNKRAKLALDVFIYSVKKYIGSYAVAMGGVDAIVFTAGIGENDARIRACFCEGLEFLGIEIDPVKNKVNGVEAIISKDTAKVKVLLIPTNEELVIARDTLEVVTRQQNSILYAKGLPDKD
ncbi:MAG: acetate/propionate family kinase [Christensenellales bacterium]